MGKSRVVERTSAGSVTRAETTPLPSNEHASAPLGEPNFSTNAHAGVLVRGLLVG
ncbi:MAG: hypothetical protein ACK40K_09705 [Raineya sp.]